MDSKDIALIEQHVSRDKILDLLYREHIDFERQLEKYNHKPFLTPLEEMERKNLQKKKLQGRDRIEEILRQYRVQEGHP